MLAEGERLLVCEQAREPAHTGEHCFVLSDGCSTGRATRRRDTETSMRRHDDLYGQRLLCAPGEPDRLE